MCAFA